MPALITFKPHVFAQRSLNRSQTCACKDRVEIGHLLLGIREAIDSLYSRPLQDRLESSTHRITSRIGAPVPQTLQHVDRGNLRNTLPRFVAGAEPAPPTPSLRISEPLIRDHVGHAQQVIAGSDQDQSTA